MDGDREVDVQLFEAFAGRRSEELRPEGRGRVVRAEQLSVAGHRSGDEPPAMTSAPVRRLAAPRVIQIPVGPARANAVESGDQVNAGAAEFVLGVLDSRSS